MSDTLDFKPVEGLTWQDRKDRVRQKFLQALETQDPSEAPSPATAGETPTPPETPGSAPGLDAIAGASSETADAPPSAFTGIFAMDTAQPGMPSDSPVSTMLAESTRQLGDASTVLTMTPVGLVASSMTLSTDALNALLQSLPSPIQLSLQRLAIGRSESLADTVKEIAKFFVEEEDARAEGPLVEAVEFWVSQFRMPEREG